MRKVLVEVKAGLTACLALSLIESCIGIVI